MCVCSGDSLQPEAERFVPFGSARPNSCLLAHEDAQEDSGTSVLGVLRRLRPDGPPHLHSKCARVCLCGFERRREESGLFID